MKLTMHQEDAVKLMQKDRLLRVPIETWMQQVNANTRKSLIRMGLVRVTQPSTGNPIQVYATLTRRM